MCIDFLSRLFVIKYILNKPFNVSHTGNYVACALSDEPVGIDIEQMRPSDQKIAERFFTLDERAYISANDSTASFYEIWTKKESRIKWEGRGLSKPLPSFSVFEPDTNEPNQPVYHRAFQNGETICHVCSAKQTELSVEIMDTAAFVIMAEEAFRA